VSIADVDASGPFSTFPGVDRVITPCAGPALRLTVDGTEHDLAPYEPFSFPGEASTSCEITAPTRDLNVMTRRGVWTADVRVVPAGGELEARASEVTFAVLLSGSATAAGTGLELGTLDGLRPVPGGVTELAGSGRLAIVRIRPEHGRRADRPKRQRESGL
jgi:environmental stress-induced protein Ves